MNSPDCGDEAIPSFHINVAEKRIQQAAAISQLLGSQNETSAPYASDAAWAVQDLLDDALEHVKAMWIAHRDLDLKLKKKAATARTVMA